MTKKRPADESFRQFVHDQLEDMGDVQGGSMFGAYGLYCDEIFFAIVNQGRLYFKVDEESKVIYENAGMEPFRPTEKMTLKSYYEVPVDVLENADKLKDWARHAVAVQRAGKKPKPRKRGG